MTDTPDDGGTQEIVRAITPFEAADAWSRPSHGDPLPAVINRVTEREGAVGEMFFRHRATDAKLHMQFPDRGSPPGVLKAFLDQPFDPCLSCCASEADTFSARLCCLHRSIAEAYGTVYTTAVADPSLLLRMHVPAEFREPTLRDTVEAVGRVAVAVDELHQEIGRVVVEYQIE